MDSADDDESEHEDEWQPAPTNGAWDKEAAKYD